MGVALIIIIVICLFWPVIVRWLQGFMARRAEDMVRRMAGMPSRKEEKRRRKEQTRRERHNDCDSSSAADPAEGVRAMKEYAEDVAFTEIREFSSDEVIAEEGNGKNRRIYREDQVSDAEYVEIKTRK